MNIELELRRAGGTDLGFIALSTVLDSTGDTCASHFIEREARPTGIAGLGV